MPKTQDMDWLLAHLNGPVNLFSDLDTFSGAVDRFKRNGYAVYEFDCREFSSQQDIYNAVLHSTGDLSEEHTYKNIKPIQFWDLFVHPTQTCEIGDIFAFRYFDTFHRLDPECGQDLMHFLAQRHYIAAKAGGQCITCVYSEDRSLELEPFPILKAKWIHAREFGEDADKSAAKLREAWSRC